MTVIPSGEMYVNSLLILILHMSWSENLFNFWSRKRVQQTVGAKEEFVLHSALPSGIIGSI